MQTPWGQSDYKENITEDGGIVFFGTPSHGGFRVYQKYNTQIPKYMRMNPGWYEEDCDWAIVAVVFPQHFPKSYAQATRALKNWKPEAYQQFFGIVLRPGESLKLDEKIFAEKHKNDYIVTSAIGRDNDMVECMAIKGGRLPDGQFASNDRKAVLVPKKEYDTRSRFGFVLQKDYQIIE